MADFTSHVNAWHKEYSLDIFFLKLEPIKPNIREIDNSRAKQGSYPFGLKILGNARDYELFKLVFGFVYRH